MMRSWGGRGARGERRRRRGAPPSPAASHLARRTRRARPPWWSCTRESAHGTPSALAGRGRLWAQPCCLKSLHFCRFGACRRHARPTLAPPPLPRGAAGRPWRAPTGGRSTPSTGPGCCSGARRRRLTRPAACLARRARFTCRTVMTRTAASSRPRSTRLVVRLCMFLVAGRSKICRPSFAPCIDTRESAASRLPDSALAGRSKRAATKPGRSTSIRAACAERG